MCVCLEDGIQQWCMQHHYCLFTAIRQVTVLEDNSTESIDQWQLPMISEERFNSLHPIRSHKSLAFSAPAKHVIICAMVQTCLKSNNRIKKIPPTTRTKRASHVMNIAASSPVLMLVSVVSIFCLQQLLQRLMWTSTCTSRWSFLERAHVPPCLYLQTGYCATQWSCVCCCTAWC